MSEKQYPLHHDHGTVTISRDVFESMTAELDRLRPMECGLELAEADRDAYKKKVEELVGKYKELAKDHDKAIQACCDADKRIVRLQRALWLARAKNARFNVQNRQRVINTEFDQDHPDIEFIHHHEKVKQKWMNVELLCQKKAKEYK